MYKKIEEYCLCDIYKNIDGGIYVAKLHGRRLATGSYLKVKSTIERFWHSFFEAEISRIKNKK